METIERNVEKQLILRFFLPDLQQLKAVAKQLANNPYLKLQLYGQLGEVLIVLTARGHANAAATELTESAAMQFEDALGSSAYGRGRGSLAYFAAGTMIENECIMAAADKTTGDLLSTEFSNTKRGAKVFDFGEMSYNDAKMHSKIKNASDFGDDVSLEQLAADRAHATAKCTKADFGVAITGMGGDLVCVAVAHRGKVYIRKIQNEKDMGKAAALTALDITRRLLEKVELPYVRAFRAGKEIEWDKALEKKPASRNIVPIITLVALVIALGFALWYLFNTFIITGDEESVPASVPTSQSVSVENTPASDSTPTSDSEATSDSVDTSDSVEGSIETPPASSSTPNSGVVHPFA